MIYKVGCKDCNANYVRQIKRSFDVRKKEHLTHKSYMIYQHLQNNENHAFD